MSAPSATFGPESFAFLRGLAANNTRDWFAQNKAAYETIIKAPANALCARLEAELASETGTTFRSKIFRINRDLRFSKDKTPYNTHVRMAFWPTGGQFDGTSDQPPSFFLSLEPDHIRFGTGCMAFAKPVLGRYLHQLEHGLGAELMAHSEELKTHGISLSEPDLARPPRGIPKDSPHADLARHKGLWPSGPPNRM